MTLIFIYLCVGARVCVSADQIANTDCASIGTTVDIRWISRSFFLCWRLVLYVIFALSAVKVESIIM